LAFLPPVSLPDGGDPITITMSIGVTVAQPDDTVTTLINRADQALYQAKSEGRNRVVPIPPPALEGS
jgi:diguanylate cyclase (GGDEF)-like protein